MVQWEYAFFSNFDQGSDGVRFTMRQPPTMLTEARAYLKKGLVESDTGPTWLHVNLRHVSEASVIGLLGLWGWELVQGTLTSTRGSDRLWVFKRPVAMTQSSGQVSPHSAGEGRSP